MAIHTISSFSVIFEPLIEGGYVVVVPALPGIVTHGKTLREARAMAQDAIRVHIEGLKKSGESIPSDMSFGTPRKERVRIAL